MTNATATLSELGLTLAQSREQRLLRVVTLSYSYTLTQADTPTRRTPPPYLISVDILGDDPLSDDVLARQVDSHELACEPGQQISIKRSLIVAQALLNEDIGDDEIKLKIQVRLEDTQIAEAFTPIVRGKF